MNPRISQHLTFVGLCSMIFYGVMLGSGRLSLDVMPQFVISAIVFLSSGRLLKRSAVRTSEAEEEREQGERPERPEPDWPWLTGLLNWTAALLLIGAMAIVLMKPPGLSLREALSHSEAHDHFYGSAVP